MSKRTIDEEYIPPKSANKKRKKATGTPVKPTVSADDRFLNQHREFILKMHHEKEKPRTIAKSLVAKAHLRDNAVQPKDISNWLQYNKNTKSAKTNSVSTKNNNLTADDDDWYSAAKSIAKTKGLALGESSDEIELMDEDEKATERTDLASKLVRFFTVIDEEKELFGLFVESGINRHIECHVVGAKDDELELTISMPFPPDDLLPYAGWRGGQFAANEGDIHSSRSVSTPKEFEATFLIPER